VVTRRILKFIEDEMKRDPVSYEAWFNEFYVFLKEGVMSDFENQEQLLRLMRYHSTMSDFSQSVSLEDYVKQMQPDQKKIYYLTGNPKMVLDNPFMESFKDSDVPVLVVKD